MTREELINLARQAGFDEHDTSHSRLELIERFAALVTASEREECQRLRGIVPEVLEKLNDELCDENELLKSQCKVLLEAVEWIARVNAMD